MSDNKPVEVDTGKLRAAGATVEDIAGRVKDKVTSLKNNLNAADYPWGHDSYGDKFTGGEQGYTKSSKNLLDGSDNMASSLERFASGMNDAANKMDKMDK